MGAVIALSLQIVGVRGHQRTQLSAVQTGRPAGAIGTPRCEPSSGGLISGSSRSIGWTFACQGRPRAEAPIVADSGTGCVRCEPRPGGSVARIPDRRRPPRRGGCSGLVGQEPSGSLRRAGVKAVPRGACAKRLDPGEHTRTLLGPTMLPRTLFTGLPHRFVAYSLDRRAYRSWPERPIFQALANGF